MKIRLEADVPAWEPGDCENCPFACTEYLPAEWVAHCVIFDGMDMDCPASVVDDDEESHSA